MARLPDALAVGRQALTGGKRRPHPAMAPLHSRRDELSTAGRRGSRPEGARPGRARGFRRVMDDPSKHPLADRSAQGILPRTPFEAGLARRKRFFGDFLVAQERHPARFSGDGIFFFFAESLTGLCSCRPTPCYCQPDLTQVAPPARRSTGPAAHRPSPDRRRPPDPPDPRACPPDRRAGPASAAIA